MMKTGLGINQLPCLFCKWKTSNKVRYPQPRSHLSDVVIMSFLAWCRVFAFVSSSCFDKYTTFLRIFQYLMRRYGLFRLIPATNQRSGRPFYFLPIEQPLLNGLRSWRFRDHGLPSFPTANKITIFDKGSSQTISWAKAADERPITDFSDPTASQWTLRHGIVETAADGGLIGRRPPFFDR